MHYKTHRTLLLGLLSASLCLAAQAGGSHAGGHGHDSAAIGEPGRAEDVSRTIQVEMRDTMRFLPAQFSARQGETIRFVVKNSGALRHEFVLGTKKDLDAHYEVMKKFPEMEHDDANMLSLAPGASGELLWKFSQSGAVHLGCLHPGHYDAGMKGIIRVAAGKAPTKAKTSTTGEAHAQQ